jgi:heme exporter protein C
MILGAGAAIVMLTGLYMVAFYVPTEATMGVVQRIFYYHVPSAWVAFLAFFVVAAGSITYLFNRSRRWDVLASASAEVGVMFCSLVLITGPIWAKPVWGIWWTWDARLTLTLVLWLIYAGYLMLRHYVEDPQRRAAFSAVMGIVGFVNVPLVYMSIRWWRTQHPQPVLAGGEDSGLDPAMFQTLMVCFAGFTLVYVLFLRMRMKIENMQDIVDAQSARLER